MSQDPVYPVGLFYVGTTNPGESTILPVSESEKTAIVPDANPQILPGGITIKQEIIDPEEQNEPSSFSADTATAADEWNPSVEVKQEDKSCNENLPVVTSVYSTAGSNDKEDNQDKDAPEDRNSESYWEKRKKFTLAFAAGLRKFIQIHPELLRYGLKDEKSLEANLSRCEKCVACLRTEDCGKCPICIDLTKFGARSKSKRICILRTCLHTAPYPERSQNLLGKRTQEQSLIADTATEEDTPSKRDRIGEQSIVEDEPTVNLLLNNCHCVTTEMGREKKITETVQSSTQRQKSNKRPKTNLERNRQFRARRKALKQQNVQLHLPTTPTILDASTASSNQQTLIGMEYFSVSQSPVPSTTENIRGITDLVSQLHNYHRITTEVGRNKNKNTEIVQTFTQQQKPTKLPKQITAKTNSERARQFRARRKALKQQIIQLHLPTTSTILDASIASSNQQTMIGMEYCNVSQSPVPSTTENIRDVTDQDNQLHNYHGITTKVGRNKNRNTETVQTFTQRQKTPTKPPKQITAKTSSERTRLYRARLKALKEQAIQLHFPMTTTIMDASITSSPQQTMIGMECLNLSQSPVPPTTENIHGITYQDNEPNTSQPSSESTSTAYLLPGGITIKEEPPDSE